MRWYTNEDVANTRMLSGWLIKRFIDPSAESVFVPKGTDPTKVDGMAFHMEGGGLSPKEGPLSRTYQVILEEYRLLEKNPAAFRQLIEIYAAGSKNWLTFRNRPEVPLRELLSPDAPPESGGLVTALLGVRLTTNDDAGRFALAQTVFDLFYNALRIRSERAAAANAAAPA
jgi:hypothetical protein